LTRLRFGPLSSGLDGKLLLQVGRLRDSSTARRVRRAPGFDRQPDQQKQQNDAQNLLLILGKVFHRGRETLHTEAAKTAQLFPASVFVEWIQLPVLQAERIRCENLGCAGFFFQVHQRDDLAGFSLSRNAPKAVYFSGLRARTGSCVRPQYIWRRHLGTLN
jgi:hypothetical protein